MSGCKRFFSLGVGAGLPACLSLSGCLSSKCVVFVALHSLLKLLIFKHLIVKEKSLYENPPLTFPCPKKKKKQPTVSFVSLWKSLGGWRRPWRRSMQLGLQ